MREPKVGEIWQSRFFHKKDSDAFEYISKVSEGCVWVVPLGRFSGQGILRADISQFTERHFYVQ